MILGTHDESLLSVYWREKHHGDTNAYFGVLNRVTREIKIFKHANPSGDFQLVHSTTIPQSKALPSESLKAVHTISFPKYSHEHAVLFTKTHIYSLNMS